MVVVWALVLGSCVPAGGGRELVARGAPRPLPLSGSLEPLSARDFEGVLVGLRGRPVVVNVWASWCGPCRIEAPLLQRAARRYEGAVVFVGVDSRDDVEPARAFIRRYRLTYPNVFDAAGDIRAWLGVRGFPSTYVFDRRGRLTASVVGGISEQALAAHIAATRRR